MGSIRNKLYLETTNDVKYKRNFTFAHNKYFILNTMHTDTNVKIILLKTNIHIS